MHKWLLIFTGAALLSAVYAQDVDKEHLTQNTPYKRRYSEEGNSSYGYGYERRSPSSNSREESYGQDQDSQEWGHQSGQSAHLSEQEERFAKWLSPMHRKVFVQIFTPSMRAAAMKLASFKFYDMDGPASSISPDQAVELVMTKFRHQAARKDRESRGCINPNQTPYERYQSRSESYDSGRSPSRSSGKKPRLSPYDR